MKISIRANTETLVKIITAEASQYIVYLNGMLRKTEPYE